MVDLAVLPRPQQVKAHGSGAPSRTAPLINRDPSIGPEGYEIRIGDDVVEVRHADAAGLRYATATLDQLLEQFPTRLPGLEITDWPDTPERAYMLDISRNRVPTMETLFWLVEILAKLRINQLQLYTEHTFAFAAHESVWRDASPMTAEEMTELDQCCVEHGIELVPCLNLFGHMGPWLNDERYRHRAECPDGFDIAVFDAHLDPLTLEPTEDNARFALELVAELTATVTSRRVNICCDEPLELGMGASAAAVAKRGKGAVFVDHLLRIVEPLIADGHDVMFWADMFRAEPELIRRLPDTGATAIAWHYDPPCARGEGLSFLASIPEVADLFGFPPDIHRGFRSQVDQLEPLGYPYWVAPGTGTWGSLIGRWPHAHANILDAIDVGIANGARGMLLTDWGDAGHMQPLSISVVPIAFAAATAWCAKENRDADLTGTVDRLLFGDPECGLTGAISRLGALGERTGRTVLNGSPLFSDLLVAPRFPATGEASADAARAVEEALDTEAANISESRSTTEQSEAIRVELEAAIRLARHGAWRIARLAGADRGSDPEFHADLLEARDLQHDAWLARSRPGGLSLSLALLDPTLDSYTN